MLRSVDIEENPISTHPKPNLEPGASGSPLRFVFLRVCCDVAPDGSPDPLACQERRHATATLARSTSEFPVDIHVTPMLRMRCCAFLTFRDRRRDA